MTDPRTPLTEQPVDEPLFGSADESVVRALRHPVDEPLWGTDARVLGALLRRP